ncbi:MAG: ABC transporter substrate-binding protein [Dongiaceae bacterium]
MILAPEPARPPARPFVRLRGAARAVGLAAPAALLLAAAPSAPPRAPIERLHAALLESMQNADALGFTGRYRTLAPVLTESFDLAFMARVSVGRYWSELDAGQQEKLADAFERFTVATYAGRFDGYSGERFEIVGDEPGPRDSMVVKTHLIKADGEPIALDYLLRGGETGWRIVDVYLTGRFSELALRRAEYTSVLGRQGFDALLAAIEDRIAALKAGAVP